MKYFVLADVHGHYDLMISTLDEKGFDWENDTLIVCGDLFDRGPMPLECLEYVMSLPHKILIRGNHEDLLEKLISRGYPNEDDHHNKTIFTADLFLLDYIMQTGNQSLGLRDLKNFDKLQDYLAECKDYAVVGDYVFVHGWIPFLGVGVFDGRKPIKFDENYLKKGDSRAWYEARWVNGMENHAKKCYFEDKTIVCGHFHTSWGHCFLEGRGDEWNPLTADFSPYIKEGIVALDACTAYSKIMHCFVFEN